jgi:transcriptional regulator with XRE-family HTH domain
MPTKPLTDILREARQRKDLSFAEIEAATGISAATVYRIEQGRTDPRFGSQLLPLLSILGLDLKALHHNPNRTKGTQ